MAIEIRTTVLAAMSLALAGCDDVADGGGSNEPRPTYAALVADQDALYDETVGLSYTDPSTLPITGSANYEGVMTMGSGGAMPEMAGELTLDMNFADSSLSGGASNFVTEDGEEMTGSLDVASGRILTEIDVSEDYTYGALLTSQLEDEAGGDYDFAGGLAGDFLGEDHSHAEGIVEGTVMTPDGVDYFEGEFITER